MSRVQADCAREAVTICKDGGPASRDGAVLNKHRNELEVQDEL